MTQNSLQQQEAALGQKEPRFLCDPILASEDQLQQLHQILQLVLETSATGVYWKDRDSIYRGCNLVMAQAAGFKTPKALIGKRDLDMPWRERAEQHRADDLEIMQTRLGRMGVVEQNIAPNGQTRWIRTNKIPLYDSQGNVVGLVGTFEDLTEIQHAEEELARSNETLKVWLNDLETRNAEAGLLRQMGELLQVCTDTAESFAVVQQFGPQLFPAFGGALFLTSDEIRGVETVATWGEGLQSDRVYPGEECWSLRRGQVHLYQAGTGGLRCRHVGPDFEGAYLEIPMAAGGDTIGLLYLEDPSGCGISPHVSELARTMADNLALSLTNIRLRESLRAQSIRDPLTGLFNRRYMEETIEREAHRAHRKQSAIGVILLDIDHFKRVNDAYGHETGDMVLREVAKLVQKHIRAADIPCRYGGEEFLLILPEATLEVTRQRADQVRQAVKEMTLSHKSRPIEPITVSLGVAIYPDHSRDVQQVIRCADEALYRAKDNGRDRVEVSA